jgi:hypothetical protein
VYNKFHKKIPDILVTYTVTIISSKTDLLLMTVTEYVTEISVIFCEIYYTLSIKKDFIPISNFYFIVMERQCGLRNYLCRIWYFYSEILTPRSVEIGIEGILA